MMLSDVPKHTNVRIIQEDGELSDTIYDFRHLDGMYSLCYAGDRVVNLARWTPVEIVEVEK